MRCPSANIESSSSDLQVSAGPEHTVLPKASPLRDLIKLFPNAKSLHLDWSLELAGSPKRLLPHVDFARRLSIPNTILPNLTDLTLDLSEQELAIGFGATEMSMLFEHLCLSNLQTLRLVFRPLSTGRMGDVDEWARLERVLKRMHFPRLKTVTMAISVPGAEVAEFDACVSALGYYSNIFHLLAPSFSKDGHWSRP